MKINFKHVAVLFGPYYNHLFHMGIAAYARQTSWHLSVWVNTDSQNFPDMGSVDGVLVADAFPAQVLRPLIDAAVPGVSLIARADGLGLSQMAGDNLGIGRLAGEHLRERGFKHYAYFGPADPLWSNLRRDGFRNAVAESAETFVEIPALSFAGSAKRGWTREKLNLDARVTALPRPCGLFCASDPLACRVLNVCLESGLGVPEDMAILGVNDDPLYCESVAVPISSVRHDLKSVGFRAAQRLEQLMNGGEFLPAEVIAPLGIAARRSTDRYATGNAAVLAALRYIDENHSKNIGVADVAAATGRPLRTLQYLFRQELHESVGERITRTRLTKATEWLERSPLQVAEIAARTGFSSSGYFHRVFKSRLGCTPAQFAKRAKGGR